MNLFVYNNFRVQAKGLPQPFVVQMLVNTVSRNNSSCLVQFIKELVPTLEDSTYLLVFKIRTELIST